ncbi:hypothetical protein ACPUVO_12060 [Pseudocolwellia sp. HL-MZ19]|uniref:HEAT repeat domain-containing protein n=1 Tax=unclassified Pseudocolwellia TaxID=2848178 RepID=UPI003CE923B7
MIFTLSLLTLILESLSLYVINFDVFVEGSWLYYFITHGLASLCFTCLCWLFLSPSHKKHGITSLSFVLVISFCMPIIGMIGLVFSLVLALNLPKPQKNYEWRSIEQLVLPKSPEAPNNLSYGLGSLRGILSFTDNEDQRLSAVNAIRYLPEKEAIPLFKIALNDLSDDVRLLAYSSLDKIEFKINETIEHLQKKLAQKPTAVTAHQIAQNYWELYYLGLAESPLKDHYLVKAREYLLKACAYEPLPKVNLLLGKVLLAQEDYSQAIDSLEQALKGGLLMKQVAPYLAEAAFMMKNYTKVRQYMMYLPQKQGNSLSELRSFWNE